MTTWLRYGLALLVLAAAGPAAAQDVADENPAVEVSDAAAQSVTPVRPEAIQQRALTDHMQLERTSIRGNQELPRVLYIVPWKDPSLGNVTGKPVNSLIDEVLAPLDRDVFLRHTTYFDQLYGPPEEGSSE